MALAHAVSDKTVAAYNRVRPIRPPQALDGSMGDLLHCARAKGAHRDPEKFTCKGALTNAGIRQRPQMC